MPKMPPFDVVVLDVARFPEGTYKIAPDWVESYRNPGYVILTRMNPR